MTTPLDRDLAERLERLAAAVPVRPAQLDPVHGGAIQSRQRVRMAWLTPMVALVLLAIVAGIIGIGSMYVLNGPIKATTTFGDFTLTLTSAKARYRTGEAVVIGAALTFDGGAEQVQISHAGSGPLGFGIREPVQGYTLEPAWRQSCSHAQLIRGVAIAQPFAKSGGDAGHADPAAFTRFMTDPSLELSSGTWHPYVVAEFSLGDCGGEQVSMRAELTIGVEDQPQATLRSPTAIPDDAAIHIVNLDPASVEIEFRNRAVAWLACGESTVISVNQLDSAPPWTFIVRDDDGKTIDAATLDWNLPAGILIRDGAALKGAWPMSYGPASSACAGEAEPSATSNPTPAPTSNLSQTSTETDGDFEFLLTSDKQGYRPGEPIRIEARLTYHGVYPDVVIGHDMTGPISFRIAEKVFGKIDVGGLSLLTCATTTLRRDEPLVLPFQKTGGFHNGADADQLRAWLADPVLTLPVGTWHVTAGAASPCLGQGAPFSVGGQLTIVVSDDASPPEPSPS